VLRALRYDTVLRVTRYVAIRAPGLTILLRLLNYHITTYCVTLGYTTVGLIMIFWLRVISFCCLSLSSFRKRLFGFQLPVGLEVGANFLV
jgi:hypothetical protein